MMTWRNLDPALLGRIIARLAGPAGGPGGGRRPRAAAAVTPAPSGGGSDGALRPCADAPQAAGPRSPVRRLDGSPASDRR